MATANDLKSFNSVWNRLVQLAGFSNVFSGFPFDLFSGGATTENKTIYVDPAGNDSAAGTSDAPVKTVNGALALLGSKRIKHAITIQLAAGNYPGFTLSGITLDPDSQTASLQIQGTMVTATVATGSATGTATSAASGAFVPASFATLTDSTQSWTVNDLRGKFLEITSGTGVGQMYPIVSNTSTQVTVALVSWSGVPSTSGYAIRDVGSVLTSTVAQQAAIIPGGVAANTTYIDIVGCSALSRVQALNIQSLKISSGTVNTVTVQSTVGFIAFSYCSFTSSTGTVLQNYGPVAITTARSVLSFTGNGNGTAIGGLNNPSTGLFSFSNSLGWGTSSSGRHIRLQGPSQARTTQCFFTGGAQVVLADSPSVFAVHGSIIADGVTTGIQATDGSGTNGGGFWMNVISGVEFLFRNGTTAVSLSGAHVMQTAGNLNVNTATNGVVLAHGARAQISSGSSMTTVTNEVTIDTVASTLASLRAASPKHLKDSNYFTVAYE